MIGQYQAMIIRKVQSEHTPSCKLTSKHKVHPILLDNSRGFVFLFPGVNIRCDAQVISRKSVDAKPI